MMKNSVTFFSGLFLIFAISCLQGCHSGVRKENGPDQAILSAEKPVVDSSRVIKLLDLYRARRFEDLQSAYAAGVENVYKISFHGRKIGNVPAGISKFKYLATLDVTRNELSELPAELADLHYLQGFYANGNSLTVFPEQICLLPLLARLDLSDNQIAEIPPEIMKMDQLNSLALENNTIMSVPVELYSLENLRVLNLAGNGLSDLPEGISGLSSLRKLDLSQNQLSTLPDEIVSMKGHLKELMIQGNRIPLERVNWLTEAMPETKIRY